MSDPIFVVAPLRSGGAVLAETLARSNGVIDVRGRIDAAIDAHFGGRERLIAADATPEVVAALRAELASDARLLDASPRHASRVPFLHAVFPGATFVYVYREPRRAIYDLGDVRELSAGELARRWSAVTETLLDDLEQLPPGSWMIAAYKSILEQPQTAIARVADFLGVAWDGTLPPKPEPLKTPPAEELEKLDAVDAMTRKVAERVLDLFAAPPARTPRTAVVSFRSVATQSFPELLRRLGVSLLVSTYQSGRLILLRAENSTTLNTHFRMFNSPMGVAVGNARIAVGTEREVWDFRNMPAVA
ncbi:MAG TPA: sulfotransferase, partial [Thermoanaerobaculia bacterium]|nr:sulfotransferase [Thermoanaerobaculia bacterium]